MGLCGLRISDGGQYPRQGSNTPANPLGKPQTGGERGTESGTPGDDSATIRQPHDPELAAVVTAWPHLPQAVRAGIVAMVRAAGEPS